MADKTNEEVPSTRNSVVVRPVQAQDEEVWRQMWEGYNEFYGVTLPKATTIATWRRILEPTSSVNALLATDTQGVALGFANYILHPSTWSEKPSCLLDDLFVCSEARGHGVGRTLIEHLIGLAQKSNWGRLYWMTREGNVTARRLYDRFCESDDFVRYSISFDEIAEEG